MTHMSRKANGSGQGAGRQGGAHAVWASLRASVWEPVRGFLSRPSPARRAALAGVMYVVLLALMTANTAPDALTWQVGDVATRDVGARRAVGDRDRPDPSRGQAARAAVR